MGGRAALAAREEIHLGEGCCGGRRCSGTALTGRSCWQAAVSRVAAALQHQLTFGELLPVPLRRSRGSAVPSDGARTCRGGRLQPDYKSPTRSQPPEPKCLCLAHQPALSAFISSPCVYEGGFLLRAAAVPRNANGERAAAALRSPWQAISSGPGPRPRWLCRESVTPIPQPCPNPWPAPCLPWHPPSSVGQCQSSHTPPARGTL